MSLTLTLKFEAYGVLSTEFNRDHLAKAVEHIDALLAQGATSGRVSLLTDPTGVVSARTDTFDPLAPTPRLALTWTAVLDG